MEFSYDDLERYHRANLSHGIICGNLGTKALKEANERRRITVTSLEINGAILAGSAATGTIQQWLTDNPE